MKLTKAERRTLERLATGDTVAYSQDGDFGWFTQGDRAFVGDEIMSLRKKQLIERRIHPDDDSDNYRGMAEFDAINEAGRAALADGGEDG